MDSIEKEIQKILKEQITPFTAAHAGSIEFVSFCNGVVKVRLLGTCKGCPLSELTLKGFVETALKEQIHGIEKVESVV